MYTPYFYGRGSELLALRAILNSGSDLSLLLPIVEPVQTNSARLLRIMTEYTEQQQPLSVVVNPAQNEFNSAFLRRQLQDQTDELFLTNKCLLPAYRVHAGSTKADLEACIKHYDNKSVILLYTSPSLEDNELIALAADDRIKFHVVLDGRMSATQVALLPTSKVIDIRDHFEKLARNADYSGQELFTDRHKAVGVGLRGIGDYTVIGRVLELGGGPAAAVAIHATYRHPKTSDIWVEHFVSDDTDLAVGDVASKFLQAATKLIAAVDTRPEQFGKNHAIECYRRHVYNGTYPGLGKNKEFQIEHHVMLMLQALTL